MIDAEIHRKNDRRHGKKRNETANQVILEEPVEGVCEGSKGGCETVVKDEMKEDEEEEDCVCVGGASLHQTQGRVLGSGE